MQKHGGSTEDWEDERVVMYGPHSQHSISGCLEDIEDTCKFDSKNVEGLERFNN